MAAKKQANQKDQSAEFLKNLLIVELAKAGVPQTKIRKIVGGDMARVNRIARFFKKKAHQTTGD
jgi:hypothetical protein